MIARYEDTRQDRTTPFWRRNTARLTCVCGSQGTRQNGPASEAKSRQDRLACRWQTRHKTGRPRLGCDADAIRNTRQLTWADDRQCIQSSQISWTEQRWQTRQTQDRTTPPGMRCGCDKDGPASDATRITVQLSWTCGRQDTRQDNTVTRQDRTITPRICYGCRMRRPRLGCVSDAKRNTVLQNKQDRTIPPRMQDRPTHTRAFTHRNFYTQKLLRHTDAFIHRSFYTQMLLHTEAFRHRSFYTQELLHTEAFTQRSFYKQKLLQTEAFTHRSFYTQKLLHTDASTHRCF